MIISGKRLNLQTATAKFSNYHSSRLHFKCPGFSGMPPPGPSPTNSTSERSVTDTLLRETRHTAFAVYFLPFARQQHSKQLAAVVMM